MNETMHRNLSNAGNRNQKISHEAGRRAEKLLVFCDRRPGNKLLSEIAVDYSGAVDNIDTI